MSARRRSRPLRPTFAAALAFVLAATAPAAGQATASTPEPPARLRVGHAALTPPPGWRRMSPDEGRALRARHGDRLPGLLADNVVPGVRDVLGPIASWQEVDPGRTGFVHVQHLDEEAMVSSAGVEKLREFAAGRAAEVPVWDLVDVKATARGDGEDAHPVLFAETVFQERPEAGRFRMTQHFFPTGGKTVVLSCVAAEDAFEGLRATFAEVVASAAMARAPRGGEEDDEGGGSRITEALLWGAVIGLILAAIHRLRRRAP